MARIEREFPIDSIQLDKQFLRGVFEIIDSHNPKEVGIKIEVVVSSRGEKSSYENLRDFLDSRVLPKKIDSISLRKTPFNKNEREKVIEFSMKVDQEPEKSYYRLIGYDDGKLSTCQKEINNLIDHHKNWYGFMFKEWFPYSVIPFIAGISLIILLWRLLLIFPSTELYSDYYKLSFVIIGIIFAVYFNRSYQFMFPFLDLHFNKTKRNRLIQTTIWTITLGLIVNLIWKIIELIFFPS